MSKQKKNFRFLEFKKSKLLHKITSLSLKCNCKISRKPMKNNQIPSAKWQESQLWNKTQDFNKEPVHSLTVPKHQLTNSRSPRHSLSAACNCMPALAGVYRMWKLYHSWSELCLASQKKRKTWEVGVGVGRWSGGGGGVEKGGGGEWAVLLFNNKLTPSTDPNK